MKTSNAMLSDIQWSSSHIKAFEERTEEIAHPLPKDELNKNNSI